MKLNNTNYFVIDRDTLKSIIDDLELDGVDHRSRCVMAAQLSSARLATPETLNE